MSILFDYVTNQPYTPSSFHQLRKTLVNQGVIISTKYSCKVVPHTSDSVKILSGDAILQNGCKIVVDANGCTLPYTGTLTHYVYFKANEGGDAQPAISQTAPDDSSVLLAIIANGYIADCRKSATIRVS